MTATSLFYPGATHKLSPAPSSVMSSIDRVVLHSTEGRSLPDYDGGSVAPHLTLVPDFTHEKIDVVQHFAFNRSARALKNVSGGVQTNTAHVGQIELVGTCDPKTHKTWGKSAHVFMPDPPEWYRKELAVIVAWFRFHANVPRQTEVRWESYPLSAGIHNGVRLTGPVWDTYKGWLGHQHVPENDHGDPGDFPMYDILERSMHV